MLAAPLSAQTICAPTPAYSLCDLVFDAPAVLARVEERGDLFAPVLTVCQELPATR